MEELTYADRVRLLLSGSYWGNNDLDGRVYSFSVSDGPLGLRTARSKDDGGAAGVYPSVAYPCSAVLSSTFDLGLAEEMGRCLADDAIEKGVDVLLGPGLNLKRLPIAGRNFEYFSEDPLLSGLFAKHYVIGVQAGHVGATIKHYCANNLEYCRHFASSEVDDQTLHELYLRAFFIALEAQPAMVMTSYNLVNGVRMSENGPLIKELRQQGFEGVVVTDWEACKDAKKTIESGTDMIFPFNPERKKEIEDIAAFSLIPEGLVKENSDRVLNLARACESNKSLQKIAYSEEKRSEVALQIAEEGMVLLKNDGVLPLDPKSKVLFTGSPCRDYYRGEGSSRVETARPFLTLDEAYAKFGGTGDYLRSTYFELMSPWMNRLSCPNASEVAKSSEGYEATVIAVGDEPGVESEFYDRESIKLSSCQEQMILDVARHAKKTVVLVYAGSAIDMSGWIDAVDAVLFVGFAGERANEAAAKILLGQVNPSGHLSETFPLKLSDVPAYQSPRDSFAIRYAEKEMVGYRYFQGGRRVLFPFGYGLSYSEFSYADLTIQSRIDAVQVAFRIANISGVKGAAVPQVYVLSPKGEAYELKGFARVELDGGEEKAVGIAIPWRYLTAYRDGAWIKEAGTYRLYVGSHVDDMALTGNFEEGEQTW